MTKLIPVLAALTVAFGATTAMAQSTAGTRPNGPPAYLPGSANEGYGAGESGYDYSNPAAALPINPNTLDNQIPGPAARNPTDPAANDNARARIPTAEPD